MSEEWARRQMLTELCWGGEQQDQRVGQLLAVMTLKVVGNGSRSQLGRVIGVFWVVKDGCPFKYIIHIVQNQLPKDTGRTICECTMMQGSASHKNPRCQIHHSSTGSCNW